MRAEKKFWHVQLDLETPGGEPQWIGRGNELVEALGEPVSLGRRARECPLKSTRRRFRRLVQ